MRTSFLLTALILALSTSTARSQQLQGAVLPPQAPAVSELAPTIERYAIDRAALLRKYSVEYSPERYARLERFYRDWQQQLAAFGFDHLGVEGRIDHTLFSTRLEYELRLLDRERQWVHDAGPLLPFAADVMGLLEPRLRFETLDPAKAGAALDRIASAADSAARNVDTGATSKVRALRATEILDGLKTDLTEWNRFYAGYDPMFTWWAAAPYARTDKAMTTYLKTLREKVIGYKDGEDEPIVGNPVGRAALVADLASEFIPYSPEDLLSVAEREFAWADAEVRKAARDMGFGDDWKAALEKVKTLHVPPGRQVDLVRDLAREAEEYVEHRDLVTVPPLAREVWRMSMMSPERQKVNPFFLGGELIQVSYPTDTMDQDDKMMSMRGNNIHFSRATVHHELIPGHHLQQFMTARYQPHRRAFGTPFWTEGWSLYWEMLLWDEGFANTPENRMGMLFWRMHRCARIIFSLRFHLNEWAPQQAIDFLVDRVGHERANAEAEVRRSFNGTYPPLYQLAYMMGGLQFRALHSELVPARLTHRQFHDTILQSGSMPVELVRAAITRQLLPAGYTTSWKFLDVRSR